MAIMALDRKHPTAAFGLTVALVAVLVAYPLSWGPACSVIGIIGNPSGSLLVKRLRYWREVESISLLGNRYVETIRHCFHPARAWMHDDR